MLLGCNWMRRSQHRIEEAEVVCILNIKSRLLDFHPSWGLYIGTSSYWVICGNVQSHILYSINNPSGSFTCECFCQDPIRFTASCSWSGIWDVFNRICGIDLKYDVFVSSLSGPSRWNSVSKDKFHLTDLQKITLLMITCFTTNIDTVYLFKLCLFT